MCVKFDTVIMEAKHVCFKQVLAEIDKALQIRDINGERDVDFSGHYSDSVQRALFAIYHISEAYDLYPNLDFLTPLMEQNLLTAYKIVSGVIENKTILSAKRRAEFFLKEFGRIRMIAPDDLYAKDFYPQ